MVVKLSKRLGRVRGKSDLAGLDGLGKEVRAIASQERGGHAGAPPCRTAMTQGRAEPDSVSDVSSQTWDNQADRGAYLTYQSGPDCQVPPAFLSPTCYRVRLTFLTLP